MVSVHGFSDKQTASEFVAYWSNSRQRATLGLNCWALNDPLAESQLAKIRRMELRSFYFLSVAYSRSMNPFR